MNRERVAVVTTSYPEHAGDPSGHFVQTEVRALENAGAVVTVFALRGPAFGWPGLASRVRAQPILLASALREVVRVTQALTTKGPFSRVIAHWAVPSAWPIARRLPSLEVVSHGGDVRLLLALPAPLRQRLVRRIMQNTNIWRFASESLQNDLLCALDSATAEQLRRRAKVVAPALALDIEPGAIEKARLDQRARSGTQPVFVSAARLVRSKRVDRAIAIALREHAMLFVIGDGPERENLERLTRERRANAYFLGSLSRPETLAHIAAADALLHTSEAEGLSSVVREAEHLGTRVIRS